MSEVSLRPILPSDASRMLEWMLDPEIRENVGIRREPSIDLTREWIERAEMNGATAARAILVGGEHVGNVVLDEIDRKEGSARVSIYIGARSSRFRGLGRRAMRLILEHAFGTLGLRRVWLTVAVDNEPAIRCYQAVGFLAEGRLAAHHHAGNVVKDALSMSLLADQFLR